MELNPEIERTLICLMLGFGSAWVVIAVAMYVFTNNNPEARLVVEQVVMLPMAEVIGGLVVLGLAVGFACAYAILGDWWQTRREARKAQ